MTRNPLGDLGNNLGEYLREQRENARLSVRQLSEMAGVSNPYLSQIERGLKKPSAEILQQLAKGLSVSAESLYVRAGLLDPSEHGEEGDLPGTRAAIKSDPRLSSQQKASLLAVYDSYVAGGAPADAPAPATGAKRATPATHTPSAEALGVTIPPRPARVGKKAAAKKSATPTSDPTATAATDAPTTDPE
ncbi:MAG: helix-turn-helix transcriptional regulator [Tetrasphaera sp.]